MKKEKPIIVTISEMVPHPHPERMISPFVRLVLKELDKQAQCTKSS